MADAAKRLEGEVENFAARSSAGVCDEADAAGIELGGAVVERSGSRHQTGHLAQILRPEADGPDRHASATDPLRAGNVAELFQPAPGPYTVTAVR
jgi:hypothetical protein